MLRLLIRFTATIIGAWRFKNRRILESIGSLLGLPRLPPLPNLLPPIKLETLVSDETKIEVHSVERRNGNISTSELTFICKLIREKEPKKIFEIGTFDGRTAVNMTANAKNVVVYTLDIPTNYVGNSKFKIEEDDKTYIIKNESGTCFKNTRYQDRIIQLYGDSGNFDFSQWLGTIDIVFVDGSHAFEYVVNDAQIAISLVRPDGMVLFHDYGGTWPGVTRALNDLFLTNQRFREMRHINGTSLAILDLHKV